MWCKFCVYIIILIYVAKEMKMKGAAGTVSQAIATPKIRPLVYLTVQAYRYAINFVSHSKTYNSITRMYINENYKHHIE